MRITLKLDDDVYAALDRFREKGDHSRTEVVNEALRRGLQEMENSTARGSTYSIAPISLGGCLIESVENVADVLAEAEDCL